MHIYAPLPKFNPFPGSRRAPLLTAVTSIVLGLFASHASGGVHYADGYSISQDNVLNFPAGSAELYEGVKYNLIYAVDDQNLSFNGLVFNTKPQISWNQYSFHIRKNSTLTINGDTIGIVDASLPTDGNIGKDFGTYAIYAGDDSHIFLNGDVDVQVEHDIGNDKQASVGANLLYARDQSSIDIGTANSNVRLWVLAAQPDLISAQVRLVGDLPLNEQPIDWVHRHDG